MLDVIDGIRELLEPRNERTCKVDDSGAEPLTYQADTLYVFEAGDVRRLAGASPHDLNDFSVVAVYVADDATERSKGVRLRAVTEALDLRRERYMKAIRNSRALAENGAPNSLIWGHIQASADADFIRALQVRGIAINVPGWRMVTT
jgi:hypothetical protein